MNAWAFLVVSSDRQAETLPDQEGWAKRTAMENGWTITRTFSDTSTGKHGARKLLDNLLAELRAVKKAERPARVLMTRLDRTGRGLALEPIAALAEIYRLGVIVHTREDGDNTISRASDTIKPILRILTGAMENEARRDKAVAKHAEKRRAGQHAGHAPYGTVLVDGKPVAYEPEARVIRAIFEKRIGGWGTHKLTRYAAAAAPPKRKADGSERKLKWDNSTVNRMLHCQTYRGIVVPEETYDAVQTIRYAVFDRTAKYDWPLRGAVRCTCGKLLSTAFSGPKRHRIRYYTCRNLAVHPDRSPYHRADRLEAEFVGILERLVVNADALAGYDSSGISVAELEQRKADVQRGLASISKSKDLAWELAGKAAIPPDELASRLAALAHDEKEQKSILAEIDGMLALERHRTQDMADAAEAVQRFSETWPDADIEEKREAAKAVAAIAGGLFIAPERGSALVAGVFTE